MESREIRSMFSGRKLLEQGRGKNGVGRPGKKPSIKTGGSFDGMGQGFPVETGRGGQPESAMC